jgi:stalled ribosome alternative rescue factor ArfA
MIAQNDGIPVAVLGSTWFRRRKERKRSGMV